MNHALASAVSMLPGYFVAIVLGPFTTRMYLYAAHKEQEAHRLNALRGFSEEKTMVVEPLDEAKKNQDPTHRCTQCGVGDGAHHPSCPTKTEELLNLAMEIPVGERLVKLNPDQKLKLVKHDQWWIKHFGVDGVYAKDKR